MMRPAHQLGQNLGLSINPKLEQFVAILQQSSLELAQTVSQKLLTNPLLQLADDEESFIAVNDSEREEDDDLDDSPMELDRSMQQGADDGESFCWETQAELGEDNQWAQSLDGKEQQDIGLLEPSASAGDPATTFDDDSFGEHFAPNSPGEFADDDGFSNLTLSPSVRESLLVAAQSSATSAQQKWLIEILIGHIDDRGWLDSALEDIAAEVALDVNALAQKLAQPAPKQDWYAALAQALRIVQAQNPAGVGAQNLQECCLLQVARWANSPEKSLCLSILQEHYQAMLNKDWRSIASATGLTMKQVSALVEKFATLTLQPLAGMEDTDQQYITPDVRVRKVRHQWVVDINEQAYPRLSIHRFIAQQIYRKRKVEALQMHLREAEQLISDLSARANMVLRVARYLVEFQRPYFELGDVGMRALLQKEVAVALNIADSTLSRTLQGKYMDTPMGVLPFNYLISKAKNTTDMGGRISATAIGSMIRDMIEKESKITPLRDETISQRLADEGIKLSRRSIVAYREQLGIAPYHLRKI